MEESSAARPITTTPHRKLSLSRSTSNAGKEEKLSLARARKVALGGVYNNQVEVVAGGSEVRPGSRIIVTTAERLSNGIPVRLIQDNFNPAPPLAEAN